jgi:cytochrome c oxidase subunit II
MLRSRVRQLAVLALLAVMLGGCAFIGIEDGPLDSLDPRGPFARTIDNLFWPVFWTAVVIFFIVELGILAAAFFFRDRPNRPEPRQIHGNTKLEVLWTAIPALILVFVAVPTVRTIFELTDCGEGAIPIEVIGHQWWFEYRYPDAGIESANVMVIPADQEVCAIMTSEDVLHNFWVPKLNGKRYLVPGQVTELRLQADEPGEYWGHCGEFCGLSHSLMRARVRALPAGEYQAWLAAQQEVAAEPEEGSLAAEGLLLFQERGCTQCHTAMPWNEVADGAFTGPNLTHFMDRGVIAGAYKEYSRENVKAWLANPPKEKPGSFMPNLQLSEQEIDALIAWLETLR